MGNVLRVGAGLAVLCALGLALAACGGGGGDASSSESQPSKAKELSGTVEVWDFEYESIPAWTKVVDKLDAEFEQLHPGVTVNRVAQPFETWEAVYRAAFAAHEGPDVMVMQPGMSGLLSFTQGLEVLNDRVSPDLREHLTQWETVTPDLSPEGEYFGVPLTQNMWVFYYNKKLFEQAGLPADFQPESWPELREVGEKLKAAGVQPFTGGNKEGYENSWWFTVGFQSENEPEQASELAQGKLPYTDEAITKAFGPAIEMQEAGLYPSDRFSTPLFTEGYARFAEGKGAITLGLMEAVGYWEEFIGKIGEKDLGFFLPPGEHPVATLGNIDLAMPKFAENKDAAWALMEFEASKQGMETFAENGYMPNRTDVSVPASFPSQPRELEQLAESPDRIVAPFLSATTPVIWEAIPKEINEVLQGRTSLEDAQSAMQEVAEKTGAG